MALPVFTIASVARITSILSPEHRLVEDEVRPTVVEGHGG